MSRVRCFGWRLLAILMLVLVACPVEAAVTSQQHFPAVKTATPPALDASLADPVWQTGLVATDFIDATRHVPASVPTTAYFLYDDKNMYIGFKAPQRGIPLATTQTVNDVGGGLDDTVAVAFDTSGSSSRTYTFSATPTGVRYESSSESARYNPTWRARSPCTRRMAIRS